MQRQAPPREATYAAALQKARQDLTGLDPYRCAHHAGVSFEANQGSDGHFRVPFFDAAYRVYWPSGQVELVADPSKPDIASRILLLHYLLTADGTPQQDRWIAFRNLPGGMGYDAAFQQRTSRRLSNTFGMNKDGFEAAARRLAGERLSFGDSSFLFRLLPKLWVAVILNLADDELPADSSVLFDATASHYLPTEDLAVLGGMLAGRLIEAVQGG